MPDGLHQRDALAWAERQADLLRRLAAGECLNEPVDRFYLNRHLTGSAG